MTVDQAGYDALADKTGYIGAVNNVFTHTLEYSDWNALADNTQYIYNEDGSFYGIAEVKQGFAKLKTKLC